VQRPPEPHQGIGAGQCDEKRDPSLDPEPPTEPAERSGFGSSSSDAFCRRCCRVELPIRPESPRQ
jgi:hypothetical protein